MKQIIKAALPPAVLFVVVILSWHYIVVEFGIKAFLVPKPFGVLQAALEIRSELLTAIGLTAAAALCGFVSSVLIGSLTACVFSQSRVIRSSCYPYAIFLQTVPIVAVAPIIVVWFGAGFHSIVLVSFMISLFPIVTNVTAGMLSVDPDLLDLFRLYRASRWQVLWKLRLPHSVPFLVAANIERHGGRLCYRWRVLRGQLGRASRARLCDPAGSAVQHGEALRGCNRLDAFGHRDLRSFHARRFDDPQTVV